MSAQSEDGRTNLLSDQCEFFPELKKELLPHENVLWGQHRPLPVPHYLPLAILLMFLIDIFWFAWIPYQFTDLRDIYCLFGTVVFVTLVTICPVFYFLLVGSSVDVVTNFRFLRVTKRRNTLEMLSFPHAFIRSVEIDNFTRSLRLEICKNNIFEFIPIRNGDICEIQQLIQQQMTECTSVGYPSRVPQICNPNSLLADVANSDLTTRNKQLFELYLKRPFVPTDLKVHYCQQFTWWQTSRFLISLVLLSGSLVCAPIFLATLFLDHLLIGFIICFFVIALPMLALLFTTWIMIGQKADMLAGNMVLFYRGAGRFLEVPYDTMMPIISQRNLLDGRGSIQPFFNPYVLMLENIPNERAIEEIFWEIFLHTPHPPLNRPHHVYEIC